MLHSAFRNAVQRLQAPLCRSQRCLSSVPVLTSRFKCSSHQPQSETSQGHINEEKAVDKPLDNTKNPGEPGKKDNDAHLQSFVKTFEGSTPRPVSLIHQLIWNPIGLRWCKALSPELFVSFDSDFPSGVNVSIKFISESISAKDANALVNCCESTLYSRIARGLEACQNENLQPVFQIESIQNISVDKLFTVIGVQRGEPLGEREITQSVGQHVVRNRTEWAEALSSASASRQFFWEFVERGLIIVVDAHVTVKQVFYIKDQQDAIKYGSKEVQTITHALRFETNLFRRNPHLTFGPTNSPHEEPPFGRSQQEPEFEASDWVLIDINHALGGNYPVKLGES